MPLFSFTGPQTLTYPQYLDEATGRTLTARPAGIYGIRPAGSAPVPVPPGDGNWAPVPARTVKPSAKAAAASDQNKEN